MQLTRSFSPDLINRSHKLDIYGTASWPEHNFKSETTAIGHACFYATNLRCALSIPFTVNDARAPTFSDSELSHHNTVLWRILINILPEQ